MKYIKRLLLISLISLLLIGCSSQGQTPEATVQGFLNALKNADIEKFNNLTHPEDRLTQEDLEKQAQDMNIKDLAQAKNLLGELFKDGFKVGQAEIKDDVAEVPVSWKAPDLSKVVGELIGKTFGMMFDADFQALNEAQQQEKMTTILSEILKETERKEYSFPISLRKVDDRWYVNGLQDLNLGFIEEMLPEIPGLFPQP